MTRYGISDPIALADASRLSRRAGFGFVMTAVACNLLRIAGYDAAPGQAFALVYAYMFFGVALATAGRRRMMIATPRTGTTSRLLTITMLGFGLLMSVLSVMTFTTLMAMVFATITG